jgi:hypothetical protein
MARITGVAVIYVGNTNALAVEPEAVTIDQAVYTVPHRAEGEQHSKSAVGPA